jgi:hypothetical protein
LPPRYVSVLFVKLLLKVFEISYEDFQARIERFAILCGSFAEFGVDRHGVSFCSVVVHCVVQFQLVGVNWSTTDEPALNRVY